MPVRSYQKKNSSDDLLQQCGYGDAPGANSIDHKQNQEEPENQVPHGFADQHRGEDLLHQCGYDDAPGTKFGIASQQRIQELIQTTTPESTKTAKESTYGDPVQCGVAECEEAVSSGHDENDEPKKRKSSRKSGKKKGRTASMSMLLKLTKSASARRLSGG